MALQPLSLGDILMLSQTAWKIGRAFAQGKKSAPSEFTEIENEANGLSEALKLVAEILHDDSGLLSQADAQTKTAVNTILESAHRTLGDLESFVERYQVIRKKETSGGFVVERSWSEVVMANYKTFKWTTEGGTITDLRNMLNVHTNTINLTMQALQSRSLAKLEKTVLPMANNVADIHEKVHGDLGRKIDDLHHIIMTVANNTPALMAHDRGIRDSRSSISTLDPSPVSTSASSHPARLLEAPPPRNTLQALPIRQSDRVREIVHAGPSSNIATIPSSPPPIAAASPSAREDSAYFSSAGALPYDRDSRRMDWGFEHGSPPDDESSIGNKYRSGSTISSYYSGSSSRRESNVPRRESTTLPNLFRAIDELDVQPGASKSAPLPPQDSGYAEASSSRSPALSARSYDGHQALPPPLIQPDAVELPASPATPLSYLGSSKRQSNVPALHDDARPSTGKSVRKSKADNSPLSPRPQEAPVFEKSLFRNAAILCDVRGTVVEYAQPVPDEPDPRFNTEMKEACKECRICVIRKRENREHGGTKVVTSVWTLSDDGTTRLQQKLSEYNETVPFGSYFDSCKVSLAPSDGASDSQIILRFHSERWGDALQEEKKTTWVNYVFVSENDAVAFQSAVFGRTLLGSYRTTKTIVIHEGIGRVLAFEEQFANIEMLRLWEDDGISTPGAAGGVMALMHVSSNFGEGWARWWINSTKQQVRVKEDGHKWAKVKGIDITVIKPGAAAVAEKVLRSPTSPSAANGANALDLHRVDTELEPRPMGGKRIPVKKVTGVRIEFKTEDERNRFVSQTKKIQERPLPLPDL